MTVAAQTPTLEEIFEPDALAALRGLFRARYLPLIDDVVEEALVDENNVFQLSPAFRAGFTRLLLDHEPFEYLIDLEAPLIALPSGRQVDPNYMDGQVSFVFRKANLLPEGTDHCIEEVAYPVVLQRWWVGDGWRAAGWFPPQRSPRRRPERYWPELLKG